MTTSSLPFHLELIDAYFAQPEYYFCAFVMDKRRPGIDWQTYFGTVWDAYLSYAKLVVKNNLDSDEEVCVIADYLGKPKRSSRFFETSCRVRRDHATPPRSRLQRLHAGLVVIARDPDRGSDPGRAKNAV